jgi:SWI/SNF-related matrix-associated actin-dependent regulator 1 of chromatin subfamily A
MDQLDDYQLEGADFLATNRRALLADVMGVGKSAQGVAAVDLVGAQSILVVCQGIKRKDWKRDFARWSETERPVKVIASSKDIPLSKGVTLVSYDLVEIVVQYAQLMGIRFDVLIMDEVQFLKSREAKRTQTVLGRGGLVHYCDYIWLLTGTPAINHPAEMWTWLYTLFPEVITFQDKPLSYDQFVERYCVTRETKYGTVITDGKNIEELRSRMWSIMLRRKEDVLKDLPSLDFNDLMIPRENITHPDDIRDLAEAENGKAGQQLRTLLEQYERSGDTDLSSVDEDFHITTLRKITAVAKARPLCDILIQELVTRKIDKLVLFGIHRDALKLCHAYFADAGMEPEIIWGGIDDNKKDRRITRFVSNHKCRVIIGQIDAAGTGVDRLQYGACDVVFLESSWTPTGNLQAIKRVHRRGQRFPVNARFAHLTNSTDERVQKVTRRKTKLLAKMFA